MEGRIEPRWVGDEWYLRRIGYGGKDRPKWVGDECYLRWVEYGRMDKPRWVGDEWYLRWVGYGGTYRTKMSWRGMLPKMSRICR